jgi:hypothetical protein
MTMKGLRMFALVLVTLSLSGCYVATVDTGLPKSTKVVSKPWASCWVYGLVPPPTIEAASWCPNGVAEVQTQHSFLNYVVGALTFGIYTPIQITVTCAEGAKASYNNQDIVIPHGASADEVRQAFTRAADRAVESGKSVFVRMEP